MKPKGHLLRDLLYFMNKRHKEDKKKSPKKAKRNLSLVVEELDSEGNTKNIAMKYRVYFSFGKYRAKLKKIK